MISFERSVGGVVFRRRGENTIMYLLLKYRRGHWDFPKGHPEKGESDEEALRREIKEETGIDDLSIIPSFRGRTRFFYRARDGERKERKADGKFINVAKKVDYFLVETKTKNVKISHEHLEYDWLGYGDALSRITYENSKNILRKAQSELTKE